MSVLPDCWINIIGITRDSDSCLNNTEISPDFDISNSGLYIDELKGINLRMVSDTGGDIWTKVERARENAIRTFQIDVMSEIMKTNKLRYDLFKGNIGSQKYSRNLALTNSYAGVRIYCNDVRGGKLKITGVNAIFGTTGPVTITVYNNLSPDPITSFNINTTANRVESNVITPIELDLWNDEADNLEYYFIYTVGDNIPKDNNTTCGCGGVSWCFNKKNPCFAAGKVTKDRWRQFAMVGGITGNDTAEIEDNWSTSSNMNGLILVATYECSPMIYLCNEMTDYENNTTDQAIAYAVLYKSGEFLMDEFLDTQEISRYTALGLEAVNNNRVYYNERYAAMLNFIASNIDIAQWGCLACKPVFNLSKAYQKL
jgi:hypothetical protein